MKQVLASSANERQDVYWWLFKTEHKNAQNIRIRTLLEQVAKSGRPLVIIAEDIDGEALSEDDTKSWADTLPASGAYLIVIDNSRSDSDYRLNVVLQTNREPPR